MECNFNSKGNESELEEIDIEGDIDIEENEVNWSGNVKSSSIMLKGRTGSPTSITSHNLYPSYYSKSILAEQLAPFSEFSDPLNLTSNWGLPEYQYSLPSFEDGWEVGEPSVADEKSKEPLEKMMLQEEDYYFGSHETLDIKDTQNRDLNKEINKEQYYKRKKSKETSDVKENHLIDDKANCSEFKKLKTKRRKGENSPTRDNKSSKSCSYEIKDYSSLTSQATKFQQQKKESIQEDDKDLSKEKKAKISKKKLKTGGRSSSSSITLPSHNTPWTEQENKLFQQGLALYGAGNWKSISLYIKTRNPLQVKNHARQYFKKKKLHANLPLEGTTGTIKKDPKEDFIVSAKDTSSSEERTNSVFSPVEGVIPVVQNAKKESLFEKNFATFREKEERVLLKKEEDDEQEIDIGDTELPVSTVDCSYPVATSFNAVIPSVNVPLTLKMEEEFSSEEPEKVCTCGLNDSDKEEELFPEPDAERILDEFTVCPEEKQYNKEFFIGNSVKNPERYLKIRNFIIQQWQQNKPAYLSKTSVRTGLKDCGDVNAIGRVHQFLEMIGAINFGALPSTKFKQRRRNFSKKIHLCKTHGDDPTTLAPHRKRKVRAPNGQWVSVEEIHLYKNNTLDHFDKNIQAPPVKTKKRKFKAAEFPETYDPFTMIECRKFHVQGHTISNSPPFKLHVSSNVLLIVDLHAHLMCTEIIGLLGGQYNEQEHRLDIAIALPCHSISTGIQCEMDPHSEMHAREVLENMNLQVCGWYHSHPTFVPNPSLRDIETQSNYQALFTKGGMKEEFISPFIGIIVNPYNERGSLRSKFNYITISNEMDATSQYRIPYKLPKVIVEEHMDSIPATLMHQIQDLIIKYHSSKSAINFSDVYRINGEKEETYMDKLLHSLSYNLFLTPENQERLFNCISELLLQNNKKYIYHNK